MYMSVGTAAGVAVQQLVSSEVDAVQDVDVARVQSVLAGTFGQRVHGPPGKNPPPGEIGAQGLGPAPSPVDGIASSPMPSGPSCTSDLDCSLNGACRAGTCDCDAPWIGPSCAVLNMAVASDAADGYHPPNRSTSWGGNVLRGDDGVWHMFAAELINHCNMEFWLGNSRVIHAVANSSTGPFVRHDVVLPVWAHEPNVVRDPTSGEWVMFASSLPGGTAANVARRPCDCLAQTGHPRAGDSCNGDRDWAVKLETYMLHASSPWGPWSKPRLLPQEAPLIDSNLAPVILANGSLIGIFRDDGNDTSTRQNLHLVRAADWRDPSSYVESIIHIRGPGGTIFDGPEDPFVWHDGRRGGFHALFHQYPHPAGPHAFSRDGITWHWAPWDERTGHTAAGTAKGDCTGSPVGATPCAYGPIVEYRSSTVTYGARERPHLIFGPTGTPVALSNGACLHGGGERCFTLLQPVAQAESEHDSL